MRHPLRVWGLAVAAAVLVAPITACSDDGPKQGEASLKVDGKAELVRQDGGRDTITGSTDVRTGDVVTLLEGSGVLDLGDHNTLELRAGAGDDADTKLTMGAVPVLDAGDLLVVTDQEQALSVDETTLRVVAGSARASRVTGLEVAAYDADVTLSSAGQEREVPALREMAVPALGHPPATARPLEYDASDPWDRRFLGDAIDLGERLQSLADGYTQNLPASTARTTEFFRQVLPGLVDDAGFTSALLDPNRPVGDTLIGAAIVDLGKRGTFEARWTSVFEFRDAGAAWGLVALDQGVDRGPLLGAVTQAVESSPLTIAPGRPTSAQSGTTATTLPGGGTTPTTRPNGTTPTTPPSTTVPSPGTPDEPGLLSPVLDPVTDLLAGLINGLLGGLFSSG
jgi:hypothetical protein